MRIHFAGRTVNFQTEHEHGQAVIRLNDVTLYKGNDGLISGMSVAPGPSVTLKERPLQERQRRAVEVEIGLEEEAAKLVGRDFDQTASWLRSRAS